jgi:proline iminopeptidase
MKTQEGRITLGNGYQVWYRRCGSGHRLPLLTLHGGPGAGHDYLEPLEALGDEREVIFYDQLGCGRSDIPDDDGLWVIDRFADEVDEVRAALGLDRIHLLGHSWGGWLALEWVTRGDLPAGLQSLILASTSPSLPQFERNAHARKAELPAEILAAMEPFEAAGDFHAPAYEELAMEFNRRYVCRLPKSEWPDPLMRTLANLDGNRSYGYMQGPSEFVITGTLKTWDRTADLGRITVPTLITTGRYDEMGDSGETLHAGIPGSRLVVFEQSAHVAHIEEPEEYAATLRGFLFDAER